MTDASAGADGGPFDGRVGTAVAACEAAGELAATRFRDGRPAGEYTGTDVKTDLDEACEARAVERVRAAHPGDAIRTEEAGRLGPADARHEWVLDPLDGTNNVACGLPLFAAAATLRRRIERDDGGGENDRRTEVAAVHEPLADDTYLAVRGEGVTANGTTVAAGSDLPLARGTVSFVLGLPAVEDAERRRRADELRAGLASACKRVVSTWAPCVDWGLLARGSLEAVVAVHPDPWERYAGELLAAEAGASVAREGPVTVHAATPTLRDAACEALFA